jgi:rhomboid protease GluP
MVSKQGIHLAVLILSGLAIGYVASLFVVEGVPLVYYLLQTNQLVYQGNFLSLFTSLIVLYPDYLGVTDAVFNAISVIFVDGLLASAMTYREYFLTFVATGLAGNLLSLLNGPYTISFGASGGIFGLVAAAVTQDYAFNGRLNTALVGWFVVIFFFNSFLISQVDWLAHAGGALFGLLIGYYLGKRHRRAYWYTYRRPY